MNKNTLILLVIVIVAMGAIVLQQKYKVQPELKPTVSVSGTIKPGQLPASSDVEGQITPTPSGSAMPGQKTPIPTPTVVRKNYDVSIQNSSFSSVNVTIKQGDTVTFTNKDSVIHTATMDSIGFNSGNLESGQTFVLHTSAMEPGSYPYHCSLHPSMKGTITIK